LYMNPILAGDASCYWRAGWCDVVLNTSQNMFYAFIIQVFKLVHKNALPADFALFQNLISSINVILIFNLGKKIHSKKIGLVAAAGAAFWIPFIEFSSCMILTETFAVTVGVVAMSMLVDCVKLSSYRDFALTGIAVGVGFLLKFSFYIWFIAIILIFLVYSILRKNILKGILVYLLAFYVTVGVIYIKNYYFYGKILPTDGYNLLVAAKVIPYLGIQAEATLIPKRPFHLLKPPHIGSGTIYLLPIVTFVGVTSFTKRIMHNWKLIRLKNNSEYSRLRDRTFRFFSLFLPTNINWVVKSHAGQYRSIKRGEEMVKIAVADYKKLLFSVELYKGIIYKVWDYITYPTFGRLTYYYKYVRSGADYSRHYINPLYIFFEHYILLINVIFGIFAYSRKVITKKAKVSDEVIALFALLLLHLLGFSVVVVPETRYLFPVIPFVMLIASYGFFESISCLKCVLSSFEC